jgi:hypothetical protein
VGVGVMRMRANGVVEAQLGLSDGQLFAAIAVVQVVSPGQQNGPQIVESAGVVGPQSAKQNKTNQLLVVTKMCRDSNVRTLHHPIPAGYKFQFISVVMQFNKQQIRKDLEVDTTAVLYS